MTRPMEIALRDSLRFLNEGCAHCGAPVTLLTVPHGRDTVYLGVCAQHLHDPDERCLGGDVLHAHGPECEVEYYDLLPLADLLEMLGVTP